MVQWHKLPILEDTYVCVSSKHQFPSLGHFLYQDYLVLGAHIGQEQIDQHEANNKQEMLCLHVFRFPSLSVFLASIWLMGSGLLMRNIMRAHLMRHIIASIRTSCNCLVKLLI